MKAQWVGVALGVFLLDTGCGRTKSEPAPDPKPSAAPAPPSSSPLAESAALDTHPALEGKTAEYWRKESGKNGVSSLATPVPDEVWGKKFRYRGTIVDDGGVIWLCRGHAIEGMRIRGVNWGAISWAQKPIANRHARVELIGHLERDGLHVTERPQRLPADPGQEPRYPLPCEEPPGGFKVRRPGRLTENDRIAAFDYAEAQADHSHSWVHWHPSRKGAAQNRPFRPADDVLVFTFMQNLEGHRMKLEERWGGPACVAKGALSREIQSAILGRASAEIAREGRRHGLLCGGYAGHPEHYPERAYIGGVAWDPARLSSWVSGKLAGFPVEFESPLEPL